MSRNFADARVAEIRDGASQRTARPVLALERRPSQRDLVLASLVTVPRRGTEIGR